MKKATIFICFLFVIFVQCKKEKLTIIANAAYAIGVIDFYMPAYRNASLIDFSYYVNGKQYVNNYRNGYKGWAVPESGSYPNGDKYMVQYNADDPQTSRFLFTYRVRDSTDYKEFVNLFKTSAPQ